MTHSNATAPGGKASGAHFARYIVIGFFTLAPLWVTWLVLDFAFGLLAKAGAPLLRGVALALRPSSDVLADWLLNPFVQYVLAALLTLAILYGVGLTTAHVLGRRLLGFMERQLVRLPVVQSIYGATKRFLNSLQKPPMSTQRVVLIAFPSPELKAIGFVTRVMCDPATGSSTGSGLRAHFAQPHLGLHRDRAARGCRPNELECRGSHDLRHDGWDHRAGRAAILQPAQLREIRGKDASHFLT